MSGGWQNSNRKATLPANWRSEIVPAVKKRDKGRCRWIENNARCATPGTDVDHIGSRDDHRIQNLRLLCGPHHARRSSAQGNAAKIPVCRPPERHPALG